MLKKILIFLDFKTLVLAMLVVTCLLLPLLMSVGHVGITLLPESINPYSVVNNKYAKEISWVQDNLSLMDLKCGNPKLTIYENPLDIARINQAQVYVHDKNNIKIIVPKEFDKKKISILLLKSIGHTCDHLSLDKKVLKGGQKMIAKNWDKKNIELLKKYGAIRFL